MHTECAVQIKELVMIIIMMRMDLGDFYNYQFHHCHCQGQPGWQAGQNPTASQAKPIEDTTPSLRNSLPTIEGRKPV